MAQDTRTPVIGVGEASELLGVTDRQVRRYLREGRIPHRREGNAYLLERTAVEELAAERKSGDGADGMDLEDVAAPVMSEPAGAEPPPPPRRTGPDPLLGRGGGSALASGLDDVFADVRREVDRHLQRTQAFHRTAHQEIDALERTLQFELGRNQEVQRGLAGILRGLGQDPDQVSAVRIDPRPKKGPWSKVRGWWGRLVER